MQNTVNFPSKRIFDLNDQYDVVVCGGGPAGIGTAVASARAGARTLLIEATSCLGGIMGNAHVSSFCASPGGPVFDELARRLLELDAAHWRVNPERFRPPGRLSFHPETARAIANEMVREAGVDTLRNTFASHAIHENGRIKGVIVATKSGLTEISSDVLVDCTADGDMAASAGASFQKGDPEDGRLQVCNFRWYGGGIDHEAFKQASITNEELTELFRGANRDGAIQPPSALFAQTRETFPFDRTEQKMILGNWELQGIDPTDPAQVSDALSECQLAALQIVRFCRRNLPGYENFRVEHFPTTLGTRESRRILGDYVLTREDVFEGHKFPDGVARAWFWIDFHDPPPGRTIPHGLEYVKKHQPPPDDWYEIPYRSLRPRDVEGMLVAGRCISCDRSALASLRVMPTCMYLGTAAGTAAALCVNENVTPGELEPEKVVAQLEKDRDIKPAFDNN